MFKVEVKTEVNSEEIGYLLSSAFEGGIGYWATIIDYKVPDKVVELPNFNGEVYKYIHYPLSDGGGVVLADYENYCDWQEGEEIILTDMAAMRDYYSNPSNYPGEKWLLDKESIARGLQVMANKYPRHYADFANEDGDATTGDVFIQCCLFGKIVYG